MKAIRVHAAGDPEVLKLEEIPRPAPAPGEVLVQVKAVGVNPVDVYIRTGVYPLKYGFPYTPGMDGAGIIEAVGTGVRCVAPGDRVYIAGTSTGTYAEFALCAESQVHRLPEHVTFAQGAGIAVPYATAYCGLILRAQAHAGETVLIHGATGGVGTAAVQIARSFGLCIAGTGGTPQGREGLLKEGAHLALDHGKPGYERELMEWTSGKGVDIILEMLANVNLAKDTTLLAPRGRIVVIGNRGTIQINPREIMGRNAAIYGFSLLTVDESEVSTAHSAIRAGLENKTLRPLVGKELPLGEAAKAHEEIMAPGAQGKIVLIP